MGGSRVDGAVGASSIAEAQSQADWHAALQAGPIDCSALALALYLVPISIAVAEFFLAIAVLTRLFRCALGQACVLLPRVFWFWLTWAGLEVLSWALSPERGSGWSEMRRVLLLGALFFVLPAIHHEDLRPGVWKGVFLSSTLASLFLIGDFLARLVYYRREIIVDDQVNLYLRTGGLLNHWMVYATVEMLVVAGLLGFWCSYPEQRRRWWPVGAINALAVALSLTRMLWISCLLQLGIALAWRRSRWFWAIPLTPAALYLVAPAAIRSRVRVWMSPRYYSNFERAQMWHVGWKMIKEKPLTGVGPGRAGKLYRSYLAPGDPVPAYHGHLHNNLIQLAAEAGLPAAGAAILLAVVLLLDLLKALRSAINRDEQFLCRTALLALTGFLTAGLFDYTYGHSLGLILLAFAVFSPLLPPSGHQSTGGLAIRPDGLAPP